MINILQIELLSICINSETTLACIRAHQPPNTSPIYCFIISFPSHHFFVGAATAGVEGGGGIAREVVAGVFPVLGKRHGVVHDLTAVNQTRTIAPTKQKARHEREREKERDGEVKGSILQQTGHA
jgi:hypothetical protein